jgi:hypothetical protein
MRALGRVYDVVPAVTTGATITVSAQDCSGIGVQMVALQTATATLTVSGCTAFSGGTTTAWTTANGFGQPGAWFYRSANTAHWTATTGGWSSNALTLAATSGYISYVDFLVSEFADTYDYIKLVAGASTYITAILYDLTVQRKPANLRIPSA